MRKATNTPAAAHARGAHTGRSPGSHEYDVELSNAAGTTSSKPLTVRVK